MFTKRNSNCDIEEKPEMTTKMNIKGYTLLKNTVTDTEQQQQEQIEQQQRELYELRQQLQLIADELDLQRTEEAATTLPTLEQVTEEREADTEVQIATEPASVESSEYVPTPAEIHLQRLVMQGRTRRAKKFSPLASFKIIACCCYFVAIVMLL